jgi:hypothetical protein
VEEEPARAGDPGGTLSHVSHAALEVSYSTYPAILETIDLIAGQIRPALSSR